MSIFSPPSENQGQWSEVGIPSGIDQYLAGGINDRAVTGTLINVTESPYFVSTNTNQTTGTAEVGSTALIVADSTGFEIGNYIICGSAATYSAFQTVITAGASTTGNITVSVEGSGAVLVAVTAGDSINTVASAIRASSFTGYTTGGTDATITFKATTIGGKSNPTLIASGTGVAATHSRTATGVSYFQIESKSGNTLTLTYAPELGSATNAVVKHDASIGTKAAIAAAASGSVLYYPAGSYQFSTGFIYTSYKTLTIRGAGPDLTTFYVSIPSAQPLFSWSAPGSVDTNVQTITGTKTKGTSTLSVTSGAAYTEGMFAEVEYENETDTARIIAGAAPVWSSAGYPGSRAVTVRVTGSSADTISIDPPLPGDATYLTLQIFRRSSLNKTVNFGVEDFSVNMDENNHPTQVFNVTAAQYCWFHNIHFLNWTRKTSAGSCIKISSSYRCEIRACYFKAESRLNGLGNETVGSDGAIETGANSSCLIIDNIFLGPFGVNIYDSGNAVGNVIAYNYAPEGNITLFHNTHPSLNLIEGNVGRSHHSDGYHGSSSHNTLYRNWLRNIVLNRFKRNYLIAGNILGTNGSTNGSISWGNPNMGNGDASGFAGPTGLSDQVGQLDYIQYRGTPNTYVIQPEDVFVGSFWRDWEITGVLIDRISATQGVFTVSGGDWYVGGHPNGGGNILATVHWNNKANRMSVRGTVTNVTGSDVTISFTEGTLPDEGTNVQLYTFNIGWQERDLDVKASSTVIHNYWSTSTGTGSLQDVSVDDFPESLAFSTKPNFFGILDWPPFNPNDVSTASATRIPAGWRALNENEDYLTGVSMPEFDPSSTNHTSPQSITITCSTPDVNIYYTTDGSTPSAASASYSSPVSIGYGTTTLKAIAILIADNSESIVKSTTYVITAPEPEPSTRINAKICGALYY